MKQLSLNNEIRKCIHCENLRKPNELLSKFIERTLLGWPDGFRHYHAGGNSYSCYESDEQWEKHLENIDEKRRLFKST